MASALSDSEQRDRDRHEALDRMAREAEADGLYDKVILPDDYKPETTLKEAVAKLRAIPGEWKNLDDPLEELRKIRYGEE